MAAAGYTALLHHAADLAGQVRYQMVFVTEARDIGGAKLVGIAAEFRQLGQADFAGQNAAVGKAGMGRQIGGRQCRMKVAKALEGGQQQHVRDRRIGDTGTSIGGEPGALEGADGGQALVIGFVANQRQPLLGAVALQIGQARFDILHSHLAVGVIRMGSHKGGQGGAGISLAFEQIDRAGGEVQRALAGGHQQGLLARLYQPQGGRESRHTTADNDIVKLHDGSPCEWSRWLSRVGYRQPVVAPSIPPGQTALRRSSR